MIRLEIIWPNTTNVYYENVVGFKVGKKTITVKYKNKNGKTKTSKHARSHVIDFTLIQQGHKFDRNLMLKDDYKPLIRAE